MAAIQWVVVLLAGYLIGSIPFSYLAGKYFKKIDIRKYGSGNVGATNAFRVLGTFPAILVLAGDILKGVVSTYIGLYVGGPILGVLAALAVLAGHNWSIFLKFRGGRGVATACGILLTLAPKVLLLVLLLFILIVLLTRYVSLGSILAAIAAPILMLVFHQPPLYTALTTIAAIIVIIKHRDNIGRLLKGTESRFGQRQ